MADKLDAKVEGINQAEKRYQYDEGFKDGYAEARAEVDAKHLPWKYAMKSDTSSLDEMTRTASEDGTADEVDEFVNTRPKFTEGDRVYHVEYPEDGPGTITETADRKSTRLNSSHVFPDTPLFRSHGPCLMLSTSRGSTP